MNLKTICAGFAALFLLAAGGSLRAQSPVFTPEAILKAAAENKANLARDTMRPTFHLTPASGFMADPNGGVYRDGWYHLFYMHSPFSLQPQKFFWGHFRSRDLLHWEAQQPAVLPAYEYGVDDVYSGSSIIGEDGTPMIFYSAGQGGVFKFWRAVGSPDLSQWRYEGPNPVLTLDEPGVPDFDPFWRDPFVFSTEGRTFLICCADLFDSPEVSVPIFEARNKELTSWEYKGTLFTYPKHKMRNFEVAEFRQLGDKWIFLTSCDAPVDMTYYFTGTFDTDKLQFKPEAEGPLDYSGQFYAQETLQKDRDNLYLIGWVPGWDRDFMPNYQLADKRNTGKSFNGCFSIPREISVDASGKIVQRPIAALKELRGEPFSMGRTELRVGNVVTGNDVLPLRGNQLEIELSLDLNAAAFCGLNVLCDKNGFGGLYIMWSGDKLNVGGTTVPIGEWTSGTPLDLRIFIDKAVVEVFVDGGRYCVTHKVPDHRIKGDYLCLTRLGGHAVLNYLNAWRMKPIY